MTINHDTIAAATEVFLQKGNEIKRLPEGQRHYSWQDIHDMLERVLDKVEDVVDPNDEPILDSPYY